MEEGFLDRRGHVFISRCAAQCNYTGAPSVHIRRTRGKHATYLELSHVPTPAKFVGWLFQLLRISTIKMNHLKGLDVCLCVFC